MSWKNSTDIKNILGLTSFGSRWVNLAELQLEEVLTDHAYCEQKAATTCITLIQRYSDKESHQGTEPHRYRRMGTLQAGIGRTAQKNLQLGKQRKDVYVNKLLEFQKKGQTLKRF